MCKKYLIVVCFLLNLNLIFAAARSYPVSEANFGAFNTNYNINIGGLSSGSLVNIYTPTGNENEDWRINYISAGVYEIENSTTGLFITSGTTNATIATQANNNTQRWQIIGTVKDFLGEYLYYKIVNVGTGKALTYSGTNVVMGDYIGADNQKWRLDLDGLEGFAALCKVKEGIKASAIGGLLGPTIFVSTLAQLEAAIYVTTPKTVVVTANMDAKSLGKTLEIGRYTTVIGSFAAHEISDISICNNSYGWNYAGTYSRAPGDNIIYKNMSFTAKVNEDDMILLFFSCKNIWLDHITFDSQLPKNAGEVGKFVWINTPYSGPDQNTNPDFITVSYNIFRNRYWCFAYGTQNTVTTEDRTTVAHNYWDSNIRRTPQIGNGTLHNYDNFYVHNTPSEENAGYATVIGGEGSTIYSESNRFHAFMKETSGYWDIEFTVGTGHLFVDYGSYTNKSASGNPNVTPYLWAPSTTFSAVSWDPSTNYSYKRINSYNSSGTYDVKAFTNSYSGSQSAMSTFRYITDVDMNLYVVETVNNPFLVQIRTTPMNFIYVYDNSGDYSWTNTSSWTPKSLPLSIDTAIIRTGEVKIAQDFGGVVKVETNGIFRLNSDVTVGELQLQGGSLKSYTSNPLFVLSGIVNAQSTTTVLVGSTTSSVMEIDGIIKGSAVLTKTNVGILDLHASASSFTGNWIISEGVLRVNNATALGVCGAIVKSGATVDIQTAASTYSLILETGSILNVGANLTVQSAVFGSTNVPVGIYKSSDFPAFITGSGTITVTGGVLNISTSNGSTILSSSGGSSYVWLKDGATFSTATSFTATSSGNYSVLVTTAQGCKLQSAVKSVNVTPKTYIYQCNACTDPSWTAIADWTPVGTPSNIDTAIIRTGEVKIGQDFGGVVKIEPNGIFRITDSITATDFRLQGGTLKSYTSTPVFILTSTITAEQSSTILAGSVAASLFQIDGTIQGSGNLIKTGVATVRINALAPNFKGTWKVSEGRLQLRTASGLGLCGVEVDSLANLDVEAIASTNALVLKNGGIVNLDANLTVQVAIFGDLNLPAGTYSSANYPAFITGIGKLIVTKSLIVASAPSAGSITLTSNSGATYIWSNGTASVATTTTYTPTVTGAYLVKATTSAGCLVTSSPVYVQSISLKKGWNLLSTNVQPTDSTITSLFYGLSVIEIKTMDVFWRSSQNPIFNSLKTISSGNGYLVNMNAGGNFVVAGLPTVIHNSQFVIGWNLMGCPFQTASPFSSYFDESNCLFIKNFDGFWMPNGTTNSILNIEPGKGYFLKK